ncbi:hypothetical protein AgCh_005386 [Apium graveolens]
MQHLYKYLISDFLDTVEELGIKQLLPPYLDPSLSTDDLKTGVNFASGGAGFNPLTSELASVISLSDQIDLFNEYIAKLKVAVGAQTKSVILTNSLFVVVAGSNDITNTYFNNPIRRLHYDYASYTDLLIYSASGFAQLAAMVRFKQTSRKTCDADAYVRAQQRAHSSAPSGSDDTIAFSVYAELRREFDMLQGKYDRLKNVYPDSRNYEGEPKEQMTARLETLVQYVNTKLEEMPSHRDRTSQYII